MMARIKELAVRHGLDAAKLIGSNVIDAEAVEVTGEGKDAPAAAGEKPHEPSK
jgi:hypothetical protein